MQLPGANAATVTVVAGSSDGSGQAAEVPWVTLLASGLKASPLMSLFCFHLIMCVPPPRAPCW